MRKFKYTQDCGILTEQQRQFYEDYGYILIKDNVSHALIDELRQRFLDICDGGVNPGIMLIMKDPSLKNTGAKGEYLIKKIQDLHHDEVFFKYCLDKAVIDVLESIVGPNITAFNSMLINKPPNAKPAASLHPIHQDLHYFPFRPVDRTVTAWTAMERVDRSNGCLYVIPGSHKGQLYPHSYPKDFKNILFHGIEGLDHLPKVNVVMDKGDSIFFHPLLLHGSGPNLSKGFRKAISIHCTDSNSYFIDVKGTSQEQVCREIEEVYARKGVSHNIVDIYKFKSRLIKGLPGNFQNVNNNL